MEGKRAVLVVDDELASREVMRDMLESLGYLVVMAQDGLEALAKLAAGVDLVLLDVNMPRMDGFEVVKHIRKRYSAAELPVIMVTGVSGRDERLRAVRAGANDFIAKPVDMTELRVRVSAQLRLKEARSRIWSRSARLPCAWRWTSSLRRTEARIGPTLTPSSASLSPQNTKPRKLLATSVAWDAIADFWGGCWASPRGRLRYLKWLVPCTMLARLVFLTTSFLSPGSSTMMSGKP